MPYVFADKLELARDDLGRMPLSWAQILTWEKRESTLMGQQETCRINADELVMAQSTTE